MEDPPVEAPQPRERTQTIAKPTRKAVKTEKVTTKAVFLNRVGLQRAATDVGVR